MKFFKGCKQGTKEGNQFADFAFVLLHGLEKSLQTREIFAVLFYLYPVNLMIK